MVNKDLLPLLRRYDQRLQQSPTRLALEMRVKRSLQRGVRTGWRTRPLFFGAMALSTALAALLFFGLPEVTVHKLKARSSSAASAAPTCLLRDAAGRGTEYMGQCNITSDGVTVLTEPGSVVSGFGRVWAVGRGRCRFKVEPIAPGTEPLRVQVNGGVIEVMGTEFLIEEREQSGSVELYSGKIRFVATGRPAVDLLPGEQLSWVRAPQSAEMPDSETPNSEAPIGTTKTGETPSSETPSSEAPNSGTPSSEAPVVGAAAPSVVATEVVESPLPVATTTLSEVNLEVERALRLRSLGQYREALRALNALIPKPLDVHTREVLSFEKGTILERLAAPNSCAHWAEHLAQFPAGRYRSLVETKLGNCEK
jgi:hypothetical protein